MSRWTLCKRRDFVRRLRRIGFEGPFSGVRHAFMVYEGHRLAIPSNSEYPVPQLRVMVREVEGIIGRKVTPEEWREL